MKVLQIVRLIVLCLILCAIAILAQEPTENTITFTVPLRLYNLHQAVISVTVHCTVYDESETQVAYGATSLDIPEDGNLEQDVIVESNELEGHSINEAHHYKCYFAFRTSAGGDGPPLDECDESQRNGIWAPFCPKPGTPYVKEVTGEITQ